MKTTSIRDNLDRFNRLPASARIAGVLAAVAFFAFQLFGSSEKSRIDDYTAALEQAPGITSVVRTSTAKQARSTGNGVKARYTVNGSARITFTKVDGRLRLAWIVAPGSDQTLLDTTIERVGKDQDFGKE